MVCPCLAIFFHPQWIYNGVVSLGFRYIFMDNILYATNQWETTLHCYVVPHWQGAYKKWLLYLTLISVWDVGSHNNTPFSEILSNIFSKYNMTDLINRTDGKFVHIVWMKRELVYHIIITKWLHHLIYITYFRQKMENGSKYRMPFQTNICIITTHLFSIERADWSNLHAMFKERKANAWQRDLSGRIAG